MADDFTAGTDTTGRINIVNNSAGEPVVTVSGTFDNNNDVDWFAITMEAGKGYSFDLRTGGSSSGDNDPKIVGIYNSQGQLIPNTGNDDGGTGNSARVHFAPTADGTYYIAVGLNTANTNLPYTLRAREDDYSQQFPGTTGSVNTDPSVLKGAGRKVTGEIEVKGDEDWFAVVLEGGEGYRITLVSHGANGVHKPVIYGVWEDTGGRMAIISGTSRNTPGSVEFVAPGDGTYYVHVRAEDTDRDLTGSSRGTYELSVREIPDDFDDGPLGSGTVLVNGQDETGSMHYEGDIDWFQVRLESGRTYQFNANDNAMDMVIYGLYAPNELGNRYLPETYNDLDSSDNARLTYTPTVSGAYYLAVTSNTPPPAGNSQYTVNVKDVTPSATGVPAPRPAAVDDYGENGGFIRPIGTLTVNGDSSMGNIEVRHDRDWFKVTLNSGTRYQIDLEGQKTGKGTLYDPYLRGIYDAEGRFIPGTTNDDGGTSLNSRVTFTPDSSGVYYISAGAWGAAQGTYELSIIDGI